MKKRIASWALTFVVMALAFSYLPTWREKVVFSACMLALKVLDMMIGARAALDGLVRELGR